MTGDAIGRKKLCAVGGVSFKIDSLGDGQFACKHRLEIFLLLLARTEDVDRFADDRGKRVQISRREFFDVLARVAHLLGVHINEQLTRHFLLHEQTRLVTQAELSWGQESI